MGLAPLWPATIERREKILHFFVWSKIKDTKHVGPTGMGQIAQCFKYVVALIPRYTIIKYHFLTLGKIIYQK